MSTADRVSVNERRQRRDLTLDEVVERAIEIAQTQGERGLTMRSVADACAVTPMALYHHVENKEALLTAIVDRVVGDAIADFGATDTPWREDLVGFCSRYRRGFLDHPTAAQVYLRRPVLSPAMARCTELMFQSFEQAGLEGDAIAEATDAVVLLVVGSIANDLTRPDEVRHQLLGQLPADETTRLSGAIDAYSIRDGDERFRRSLGWLIDGLLADLR